MPTNRSVVWLDLEKRTSIFSRTSTIFSRGSKPEVPPSRQSPRSTRGFVGEQYSPRQLAAPSPGPWIDLASVASSSVKGESSDSESIQSYKTDEVTESISHKTPSEAWEIAAGYEKGGIPIYYTRKGGEKSDGERSRPYSIGSKKHHSMISVQSESAYPNPFRLTLITIVMVISSFLVSLDRTIVTTAMYNPVGKH
jgi:hypothetical protein